MTWWLITYVWAATLFYVGATRFSRLDAGRVPLVLLVMVLCLLWPVTIPLFILRATPTTTEEARK